MGWIPQNEGREGGRNKYKNERKEGGTKQDGKSGMNELQKGRKMGRKDKK